MKNLLNLGKALNKAEQKNVFGGGRIALTHEGDQGNCAAWCNSGNVITALPNCSQANQDHACTNQGGSSSWCSCVNG